MVLSRHMFRTLLGIIGFLLCILFVNIYILIWAANELSWCAAR